MKKVFLILILVFLLCLTAVSCADVVVPSFSMLYAAFGEPPYNLIEYKDNQFENGKIDVMDDTSNGTFQLLNFDQLRFKMATNKGWGSQEWVMDSCRVYFKYGDRNVVKKIELIEERGIGVYICDFYLEIKQGELEKYLRQE